MARWKYKALSNTGAVYEGTIPMPDDDEIEMFQRLQDLRGKLHERGYQFLEARQLTKEELTIENRVATMQARKNRVLKIPTDSRAFFWLLLLFCPLAVLLFLLLVL